MDAAPIDAMVETAVKYDESSVFVTPREELLTIARSLVSN
jgi:hypothetical protein